MSVTLTITSAMLRICRYHEHRRIFDKFEMPILSLVMSWPGSVSKHLAISGRIALYISVERLAGNCSTNEGCTGALFVRTACVSPSSLCTNVGHSVTIVLLDALMASLAILSAASVNLYTYAPGSLLGLQRLVLSSFRAALCKTGG